MQILLTENPKKEMSKTFHMHNCEGDGLTDINGLY